MCEPVNKVQSWCSASTQECPRNCEVSLGRAKRGQCASEKLFCLIRMGTAQAQRQQHPGKMQQHVQFCVTLVIYHLLKCVNHKGSPSPLQSMHGESFVIQCSSSLHLASQKNNPGMGVSKEIMLSMPAAHYRFLHLRNMHGMSETRANTSIHSKLKEVAYIKKTRYVSWKTQTYHIKIMKSLQQISYSFSGSSIRGYSEGK